MKQYQKLCLILFFLGISTGSVLGQNHKALYQEADSLYQAREIVLALEKYQTFLKTATPESEGDTYFTVKARIFLCYYFRGDYLKASKMAELTFNQVREYYQDTSKVYLSASRNVGLGYILAGQDSLALKSLKELSELIMSQPSDSLKSLFLLDALDYRGAVLVRYESRWREAISCWEDLNKVSLKITGKADGGALMNISDAYMRVGMYDSALFYSKKCIELMSYDIENYVSARPDMYYSAMANSYYGLGLADSAIFYYQRALESVNNDSYKDPLIGQSYGNLALVYNDQGYLIKSIKTLETGIEYILSLNISREQKDRALSKMNLNLALVYTIYGDSKKAKVYFKVAEAMNNSLSIDEVVRQENQGNIYRVYSKIALLENDTSNAILYSDKSLSVGSSDSSIYTKNIVYHLNTLIELELYDKASPYIDEFIDRSSPSQQPANHIIGLVLSAKVCMELGELDLANKYMNNARSYYEQYFTHSSEDGSLLIKVKSKDIELLLRQSKYSLANREFRSLLTASVRYRQSTTVNEDNYKLKKQYSFLPFATYFRSEELLTSESDVFDVMEKYRLGQSTPPLRYEDDLLAEKIAVEDSLKERLAILSWKLLNGPEEEKQPIKRQITEASDGLLSIEVDLKSNHPNYHKLKYSPESISLSEAQSELETGQALIEYFVGDSVAYAFILTKESSHIQKLEANYASVHKLAQTMHTGLKNPEGDWEQWRKASFQLYKPYWLLYWRKSKTRIFNI